MIETEWLGSQAPHRVTCSAGHDCAPRPADVATGKGVCRPCGRVGVVRYDSVAAWQRFQRIVQKQGGQVTEPEWLGTKTKHRVVCAAGHKRLVLPDNILAGRGLCLTCAGLDPETAWRKFQERVKELGGSVIEPKWLGSGVPHRAICSAGHPCAPFPANLSQAGRGMCRVCAGQCTEDAERRFRERIKALGGVVVEPRWLGTQQPHRVICAAGHESAPWPNSVLRGQGICPVCTGRDPADAWRRFQKRVRELGGRVLETEWLGSQVRHRVICAKGHACRLHPAKFLFGGGICPACSRKTPEEAARLFQERIRALGGIVVEPRWLGGHRPHRVVCAAGHECRPRPANVISGQGLCRACAWSLCNAFYVVENRDLDSVKIGITNGDGRDRVLTHARSGFNVVLRSLSGLADAAALELHVLKTLKAAGFKPVRGREYFDRSALAVILDIVDNW